MVEYLRKLSVVILKVNNPPVNALSHHVRVGLADGVRRANEDKAVTGIVLHGAGGQFIAGADIREFSSGAGALDPILTDLCDLLESSAKPVVCAVEGFALGGGLEVAISAHYRIARKNTLFGFPEVNLGLLPGATGTQRLPRLAGLRLSLDVIPSGNSFSAARALQCGVIDRLVEGDVVAEAVKLAVEVGGREVGPRRVSKMAIKDADIADKLHAAAVERVSRKQPGLIAPLFAIKSVMAAVGSTFEQGRKVERQLFSELMTSGQARALQYAFFAQRKAVQWSLPDGASYKNTTPRPVRSVGVIGAGTMGSGIAMAVLNAGLPVVLLEQDNKSLEAGVKLLKTLYGGSVSLGLLTAEEAARRLQRLTTSTSFSDLRDADLVVEAVYENLALKQEIFKKLDNICKPDATLCSNTSGLSIDEMAAVTRRPANVIGTHFFVPAYHMKMLENVRGKNTSPATIATATTFGQKLGKIPVLVGNCSGFVGNRIMRSFQLETFFLLEEGCSPEMIDQVSENFGFPMGPLKVNDLAGLDIGQRRDLGIAETLGVTIDASTRFFAGARFSPLVHILAKHGRIGRKAGAGWYEYDKPNGKVSYKSAFVADLLKQYRKDSGIPLRQITSQEILERTVYGVINEGFKILEEGIASRPEDIDTILLQGYAWPRQTGGPMYYASSIGLANVYRTVEQLSKQHVTSPHWVPSKLLQRLAGQPEDVPLAKWTATLCSHL